MAGARLVAFVNKKIMLLQAKLSCVGLVKIRLNFCRMA